MSKLKLDNEKDRPKNVREVSAFCFPDGLWQYKVWYGEYRCTFPALNQQSDQEVGKKTEAYVDDVATWTDNWQEHLGHIRNLFIQVRAAGLGSNLGKSNF